MKITPTHYAHTPGPWYAIPGPSFDQILIGRSPAYDPRPIATVNPVATHESDESVAEQKANARLIAAAPELKEMLQEISAHVVGNTTGSFEIAPSYIRAVRQLLSALT